MIELRLLGTLDLKATDGHAVHSILAQPKRLALLAYLALHTDHGARRDTVVALFWPDLDAAHARGALRQSLRFLRRELGDGILNGQSDEAIAFEPGTVWCDVVAFEQACKAGHGTEALQLYRGGFLEGCFVSGGSTELEAWIGSERTRLGLLAVRAAADVADDAEREGDLPAAVQAARRAIALDPDDEKGLGRLIALLDRSGDRAGALSAFETFRRRLRKEYDATPSPETAARIQAIRTRETPFADAATPRIPVRRRHVRRVVGSVLGGAVAMAMIGWLSISEGHRSSVVILPLTNATQDTALTYLTEGLSEGVTAALSRIPGLHVTNPQAVQMRATVNADAVIAWTLRRQGDSLVLAVELKRATIVRAASSNAVMDLWVAGKLDAVAGVKPQLEADARRIAGLRMLPGRFMAINQAMGTPRDREAGARYLRDFIEEMKSTGFVAEAFARNRITGASMAP